MHICWLAVVLDADVLNESIDYVDELVLWTGGGLVYFDDYSFKAVIIFFELTFDSLYLFSSSPRYINTITFPTPARPVRPNLCTIRIGEARQS